MLSNGSGKPTNCTDWSVSEAYEPDFIHRAIMEYTSQAVVCKSLINKREMSDQSRKINFISFGLCIKHKI